MEIGSFRLPNRLVLAPMAGVTDRPFRQLCKRLGAGMAVPEMVTSDVRLWQSAKSRRRLNHDGETEPRVVQIAGADPKVMAEAARLNVDLGAQIIDINMGCPAKKVCKAMAGSALLQNETLVARLLDAVVQAVDVPVTLKMRTGTDPQHRNGVRIARIAEAAGVQLLAVHGRTRACRYGGHAEYETIRAIKHTVAIPVVANGDIDNPDKAAKVLHMTGADGIMIGRAAQGRPWLFREIDHCLKSGESLQQPTTAEVRDLMLDHLENLYCFYGARSGVRVARKHIGWYIKQQPNAAAFWQRVNHVEEPARQLRLTRDFFDGQAEARSLAA